MIYIPNSLLSLDPGNTDYLASASPKSSHNIDMLEVQT